MRTQKAPDAGELRDRIKLLELRTCPAGENGEKGWEWKEYRRAWAKATPTEWTAIYTKRGVGTREVEFIIRKQSFGMKNAILWEEQFCLPTAITPVGPGHWKVTCAKVTVVECRGRERTPEGEPAEIRFPAAVAEKYMTHTQAEPMARNGVDLVLVTPPEVRLALGSLIWLGKDGEPWWVKIPHELDPYRNEYEVGRNVEP